MIRLQKNFILLVCVGILAGCVSQSPWPPVQKTTPKPQQPRDQVTPLPSEQAPEIIQPSRPARPSQPVPPSKPEQVSSKAVMSLLGHADSQVRSGQLTRAVAILQRALNIEPRNPFVYQRLAAVRLAQNQFSQAEALAHKSNSLAVGNPFIQADNWLLIAHARRMRGDQTGQRKAMAKVERLRLQSAALK